MRYQDVKLGMKVRVKGNSSSVGYVTSMKRRTPSGGVNKLSSVLVTLISYSPYLTDSIIENGYKIRDIEPWSSQNTKELVTVLRTKNDLLDEAVILTQIHSKYVKAINTIWGMTLESPLDKRYGYTSDDFIKDIKRFKEKLEYGLEVQRSLWE